MAGILPSFNLTNGLQGGSSAQVTAPNTSINTTANPLLTNNGLSMNTSGTAVVPWATSPSGGTTDPNALSTLPGNGATTTGVTGRSPDLSAYDSAIGTYQNSLDRLPTQLGIAQGNINTNYNTSLNGLDSTKAQAQNTYNTNVTQNGQTLRTNKNVIADQASTGLRGLLHTLSAYGAGGSSDALFNAPQAVANQASAQRAGAGETFAKNEQGLDTNWNNFVNSDSQSRQKLNDWRTQQLNSTQSTSDVTKQDILSKLANITGLRAQAAGGSYAGAAQPYLDQASSLNSTIDSLGAINPTFTGTTPVYTPPTLDSYNLGAGTGTKIDPTAPTGNNISPYLSLLLGNQTKNNQNNPSY